MNYQTEQSFYHLIHNSRRIRCSFSDMAASTKEFFSTWNSGSLWFTRQFTHDGVLILSISCVPTWVFPLQLDHWKIFFEWYQRRNCAMDEGEHPCGLSSAAYMVKGMGLSSSFPLPIWLFKRFLFCFQLSYTGALYPGSTGKGQVGGNGVGRPQGLGMIFAMSVVLHQCSGRKQEVMCFFAPKNSTGSRHSCLLSCCLQLLPKHGAFLCPVWKLLVSNKWMQIRKRSLWWNMTL